MYYFNMPKEEIFNTYIKFSFSKGCICENTDETQDNPICFIVIGLDIKGNKLFSVKKPNMY